MKKFSSSIEAYIDAHAPNIDSVSLAYIANLETVSKVAPEVAKSIVQELVDQRCHLKLIASENFSSLPTQSAMANLLTDKYSEGVPFHRFYAGCDNVDTIEQQAVDTAKELFGAEHAYVQPHSGADANLIAFWSVLRTRVIVPELENMGAVDQTKLSHEDWETIRQKLGNQKLLGMDMFAGGHLTHGYRHNVSSFMFDTYTYGVDRETCLIDYDELEKQLKEVKPLIFLVGYSAYPRKINFAKMRKLADSVGAVLMVDMAHFAGLVAGKVFTGEYDPIPYADIVTTTTHKTLRGPRGGMILCKKEFAESVNKGCPLVMGGPLPHVIAAKLVAFKEALQPEFQNYAQQIVRNANALAEACKDLGIKISTDGTDNHLMLIDVRPFNLTGRQAESVLRECGITLNRNGLPFDPNGAWYTSGLRIGTPAVTSLGMKEEDMKEIASIICEVLSNTTPKTIEKGEHAGELSKAKYNIAPEVIANAKGKVDTLLATYPLYPELDIEILQEHFLN